MFSLGSERRYWLYSEATDMRKSFYTLSGIVNDRMGADPRNGDVYVFVNRRRNRMKLLHYEKGGMVIYSKMLDRGTFAIPAGETGGIVSAPVLWERLRKIVEGVMSDPDSRQARQESLKELWKR